ncbi:MAG: RluA family pseudouridine synthase [Bacilli bacterium]|jgi:23S rRNA pseudouridine1911/1915/1917 synthase
MQKKNRNKQEIITFTVNEEEELLVFLLNKLNKGRNKTKNLLTRKQVLVNDIVVSQYNYELVKGDVVKVTPFTNKTLEKHKIPIIYEDDMIIVVDKPAGLLSISSDKEKQMTAFRYVNDYIRTNDPRARAFVLHRLDKETSGVLVFAKTNELVNAMHKNWNRYVTKRGYFAVIQGKTPQNQGVIRSHLHQTKTQKVYVGAKTDKSKYAETHYKFVRGNKDYSLYDVELKTGRKNQIRVQFSELGFPIINDDKYDGPKAPVKRLGLHAYEFSFINPITKKRYTFKSPLPKPLANLVK